MQDYAFGTAGAFKLPAGVEAFGADCSILSRTTEEHYTNTQALMQQVLQLAHERGMQFAMGFEFGVLPPEFFSLQDGQSGFYWPGEANMIPDPTHPLSIQLLYAAIDNILETYKGVDWIWLWLNEHSFMGVDPARALQQPSFRAIYDQNISLFANEGADEKTKFIGVWSLQYLRLAKEYLQRKAPDVKLMLGGWGGGNQLPLLLKGLNKGLPKDIAFSCLNPDLGKSPQPAFLAEISKNRVVMAIPWLEGDHQLWHYQPRVQLMKEHVQLAGRQGLQGVAAIHWRTKETAFTLRSFARFAKDAGDLAALPALYFEYLTETCGPLAAHTLTPFFVEMDTLACQRGSLSPEYYAYTPQWGALNLQERARMQKLIVNLESLLQKVREPAYRRELEWFRSTFRFELLLDETGRCLEPAYRLRAKYLQSGGKPVDPAALQSARQQFEKAPVEQLFKTFAAKQQSRGELGILSSLNQKLWTEYLSLQTFLQKMN
ncbi:hypothetical protein FSB84_16455 [Pseudobacter ginsenosidimutans]|nr:hypothetical protein [Pseudobacter ginsenosidimutans]QEC43209.1 hypothetical protein FSB84_16455 [Pseudobacter ginsenosidimutans]